MRGGVIAFASAMLIIGSTAARAEEAVPLAEPDTTFIAEAVRGGLAEVELGRTGAQKASDPEVKRFAERMVTDHSATNDKLMALAKKHKIEAEGTYGTPPLRPEEQAQTNLEKLKTMSGKAFDQAFMSNMTKDHEKAVALFQDEAKNGKDQEMQALASATLPTLNDHLEMARSLAKKVGATP
jgi:putative membrane protein